MWLVYRARGQGISKSFGVRTCWQPRTSACTTLNKHQAVHVPAADQALEEGRGKSLNDSAHGTAPTLEDKKETQNPVPGRLTALSSEL